MIKGNINNISLSTSSFENIISSGRLYVDKTRLIENFLVSSSEANLIARQRRMGKSLNMDMIRCFLTDKQDMRYLFRGLYIETSLVWEKANSAPIFYFDFKGLSADDYKKQILEQFDEHVYDLCDTDNLKGYLKRKYENIISNPGRAIDSLQFLTELAFRTTGKRSYLLIDEYDNLLMRNYNSEKYEEIREFETALLSAALKGNNYLEKALLTGVMRISHESMLSGLNNIVTFDVFGDKIYTDDYGLTDDEVLELSKLADFNPDELRNWYNGIRIDDKPIYNIYSVMSYLNHKNYDCYWGKSGTMHLIAGLLNDDRKATLTRLLNGELAEVSIASRISLRDLTGKSSDQAFYSLLVQAGYLALCGKVEGKTAAYNVSIPNKELMIVWKEFILENLYSGIPQVRTLFDHTNNLEEFARDLEYFLSDRLSYHNLSNHGSEPTVRVHEQIYHVFLLGILSAYENIQFKKPLSNRESGDGRYDILVEKLDTNYIFEFKAANSSEDLEKKADEALLQIESKRYGVDLGGNKKLIKIGVALHNKACKVKCCI